ncbi:MAG: peptidoglycan DD-metalloendopeptidase family protein [Firmicutes bacterium]|nr:peptidoglycan DD-metalloendopeptidase family protein [Bacillota bacterium]
MKDIIKIFLICMLLTCFCFSYLRAEDLSQLREKSGEYNSQIQSIREDIDGKNKEIESIKTDIDTLDAQTDEIQENINKTQEQISKKEDELSENNVELEKAKAEKEEKDETFKKRLRVIYEQGDIAYIESMLDADNFSDLLKKSEYASYVSQHDKKMLTERKEREALIKEKGKDIEEDKKALEELSKEFNGQKDELNKKIDEKNKVVAAINSDINSYNEKIKELEAQDEIVQEIIRNTENTVGAGVDTYSSNRVYNPDGKTFQYPVPAYEGYPPNGGYGYRISPIGRGGEFHTGLDLKATLNTDIIAAEAGTVIYAGWRGGYGKCIIIDHGNGYSTLYGHTNELRCHVGEIVERGQVIAGAGTTGYSTGVHLHFEVRINGAHTDPTSYIY